ncbi:alpha-2-macroglobulin family protein [Photobacterium nomapromontoriensis]|uniref:alpha-2-macroglobulin family protein n=1 Tax=Photobacterium nomapromontoriensis TaxID=2910237 RepID=UPI003D103C72
MFFSSRLASKLSIFFMLLWLSLFMPFSYAEESGEQGIQTPAVSFVGSGPLVPRSNSQSIPINFINLSQVDVEILQITDPETFLNTQYLLDTPTPYALEQLKHAYKSVYSDRFSLPPSAANKQASARIPIPHDFSSGWYVVVLKAPGSFYDIQAKHMLLTDVGIQARLHANQSVFSLAWLSSGEVITQGEVELYRDHKLHQRVAVNDDGLAVFDFAAKRTDVVVARVAGGAGSTPAKDIGILPLREVPLDLSDLQIGGRAYQPVEAFIYSNRDLVKPGESLPINILLRDQDGQAITEQSITLTVLNPRNEVILTEQLAPQMAGYFSRQLATASSWMTGRYKVEVRIDPSANKPISRFFFELEEFVPERMDLTFGDLADFVVAGEDYQVELTGRYLFGSPAAGNTVLTDLTFQPIRHFTGEYADFIVGQPHPLSEGYASLDKQRLSPQGTLGVVLPTPSPQGLKSPIQTVANFSLLEAGGAAVQRYLRYVSWADSPIPGIKPVSESVGYDSDAEFTVGLLSHDGQALLAGELEVTFDYDQGEYYWLYEDGVGWTRKKQDQWRRIASQTVTVADGQSMPVSVPVKWGNYRITVTDKHTDVVSEYLFYAGWYSGSEQVKAKPDHADIQLDKKAYTSGEEIQAAITAPIAGSLLVTLETDKVVWSQRIAVEKGVQQVRVPLEKGISRHDIYLTATLTAVQAATPKRYFGIVPVALERADRQLTASLTLPEVIRPMERLVIPVTVDNIAAESAGDTWVTLSIVDKGIINLSRFMPQDPFGYFFDQRRYSADVVDLYSRLYDLRKNPFAQSRFGSDAVSKTDNKNDDVVESKTVILMSQPVQVVDGNAVVELDIPDYNGEGQIIATVFNASQVGLAVEDAPIAAPVVAELSIPRFLVPGDSSSVTVDLHNLSGQAQQLALTVSNGGELALDTSTLPPQVDLADGGHVAYRIPFQVSDSIEQLATSIRLQASSDTLEIDRAWSVPIRPVMPWVTKASSEWVAPGETVTFTDALWQGLASVNGKEGHAYISQTPVLSVTEQARDLYRYPYGCAEQTTSKALPYLYHLPELEQFKAAALQTRARNLKKGERQSDQAILYQAVMTLKTMQTDMGGFSLWDSYGSEQPWLSVYVTDFLLQVEKAYPGTVPVAMLSAAQTRLSDYLTYSDYTRSMAYNSATGDSALAYAAYVMSAQGKVQWSHLDKLGIEQYPSLLSYLQLAASFAHVGDSDKALAMLKQAKTVTRSEQYLDDYGSDIRDNAQSVQVLVRLQSVPMLNLAASELQAQLLESAVEQSLAQSWLSTQERGALLQAAVVTQQKNAEQVFDIAINDKASSYTGTFNVPLLPEMTITNNNTFPLYINLQAQGYQLADRTVDNGKNPLNTLPVNALKRMIYTLSGTPFRAKSVVVGERVLMIMQANFKEDLPNGLWVETIPAGFVLENPRLNQGLNISSLLPEGFSLDTPTHEEYRNDRFVLSHSFSKGVTYTFAYVLRAEVPGQFTVPPVYIENMYSPSKHLVYWLGDDTISVIP